MKSFFKRLIIFLISAALALIVSTIIILVLNKNLNKNCFLDEDITSLIIGDSHTMWSIKDTEINNLRNISLNAEGYIFTYRKLEYLLKQTNNIQKIYLGFSYHNLSEYFDDYTFGYLSKYFYSRYFTIMKPSDYVLLIKKYPLNFLEIPKMAFAKGLPHIIKKDCQIYGTFPQERMTDTLNYASLNKRIQEQFFESNGKVRAYSKSNLIYAKKIIELCRENDIEVIALSTPLQKDYLDKIPEQYKIAYNRFLDEYDLKAYAFLDFTLPDSCYLPDADHVNYIGALRTTEKFKEYHMLIDD